MADGPKFGMYVRSVKGHAVQRYGTRELIGGTRKAQTKAQKLDGEDAIEWSDRIVPLTEAYCRRYGRELSGHVRAKELIVCSREDWEAQCLEEQKRIEEASMAALEAAKTEAPEAPSAGKRT